MARLLAAALLLLAAPAQAQERAPGRVPDWAADAVWYQVFPERFRDGDPANQPTRERLEYAERAPVAWRPTPWTADWYERADWEREMGPGFYDGVFHRRLGGDLQGVLDKLPYLDSLGVTALYFNPVFYAPSLHKYDAAAFHHIDPFFGPDPEGDFALMAGERPGNPKTWTWTAADKLFLRLVDEAHARGIRVVLDGVFNHTSPQFWAFQDVVQNGRRSRYRDWYEFTRWDDPETPENELDWNGWWGFKGLPVFRDNRDSTDLHKPIKEHVFAATRRWMDPDGDGDPADGIDGWRLDVAEEVPTGFWRDWNRLVRRLNPQAYTVAEAWGESSAFVREGGFSAVMNYHGFAIPVYEWLLTGRTGAEAFAARMDSARAAYPYAEALGLQNLLDSHDTDRVASMIVNPTEGYDRNNSPRHDSTIAVRAPTAEERELQRMAVVLQAAYPGAPMVYYGDEAGMWGADDPDDRKPMVWADLDYAVERADPLGRPRRPDTVAVDRELLGFYREAFALRTRTPALRRGTFRRLLASDSMDTYVFARAHEGEEYVVVLNRSAETQRLRLPGAAELQPLIPVLASRGDVRAIPSLNVLMDEQAGTTAYYAVPPRTAVVYRRPPADDPDPDR